MTDYDAMQTALPLFDLQRGFGDVLPYGHVAVSPKVEFERGSFLLSRVESARLASLKTYMRTHPEIAARIVGHGDGADASPTQADLAESRAWAVVRALAVDVALKNAVGVSDEGTGYYAHSAEIILMMPHIGAHR